MANAVNYSIKQVSDITGIPDVTLRAWERRYHLYSPRRNAQGQRVFTANELQLIQKIQYWRQRDVNFSDIRRLLRQHASVPIVRQDSWQMAMEKIKGWIKGWQIPRVFEQLDVLHQLYSPQSLCTRLLQPLIREMHGSWLHNDHQAQASQFLALLESFLLDKLSRKDPQADAVLMMRLPGTAVVSLLLEVWKKQSDGEAIRFATSPCSISQVAVWLRHNTALEVVLVGHNRLPVECIGQLHRLSGFPGRCRIMGDVTHIHQNQLQRSNLSS